MKSICYVAVACGATALGFSLETTQKNPNLKRYLDSLNPVLNWKLHDDVIDKRSIQDFVRATRQEGFYGNGGALVVVPNRMGYIAKKAFRRRTHKNTKKLTSLLARSCKEAFLRGPDAFRFDNPVVEQKSYKWYMDIMKVNHESYCDEFVIPMMLEFVTKQGY